MMAPVVGSGCWPACRHTVANRACFGSFMVPHDSLLSSEIQFSDGFRRPSARDAGASTGAVLSLSHTSWPVASAIRCFADRLVADLAGRPAAAVDRDVPQGRVVCGARIHLV